MEPIKNNDPRIQSVDPERDSSAWTQFVRPELCGGLSVQARYLRDSTKENELRMRNIDPFTRMQSAFNLNSVIGKSCKKMKWYYDE